MQFLTIQMILDWGIEWIRLLQSFQTQEITLFFTGITHLGHEYFYIITLPLFFSLGYEKLGTRISIILLLSALVNFYLKDYFALPRPFLIDPELQLVHADHYSFPSGHAQTAAAYWGTLILNFRNRAFSFFSVGIVFLIGLSRNYLGVHYPSDVIAGWFLGFIIVFISQWTEPHVLRFTQKTSPRAWLIGSVFVPAFLVWIHPSRETVSALGALSGLLFVSSKGLYSSNRTQKSPKKKSIELVSFALVSSFLIYIAMKIIGDWLTREWNKEIVRGIRYFVIGTWIASSHRIGHKFFSKYKDLSASNK